jgi:peroxiredoxin
MPSLEQLHHDLSPRGLHVVAVAVDDPGYEDRVRAFVTTYRLTFEILSEGSGKIEADYQSRGIPSTYLIDRDGVVRMKVLGAADWGAPDVRRRIEAVLRGEDETGDGQPSASARSVLSPRPASPRPLVP